MTTREPIKAEGKSSSAPDKTDGRVAGKTLDVRDKPPRTEATVANQSTGNDFIRELIDADLAQHRNEGRVHTRFPPEPNGYLHIGHAKAICLNFGIAEHYSGGLCNLRMDDSNPDNEKAVYAQAIQEDVRWLGYDWGGRLCHASDYYEQFYAFAVQLIKDGHAYVDDLSPEQLRAHRGTLTSPGKNSPNRERPVTENLELFNRMRAGEFAEGSHLLRAKIDMASPNMNLRDPVIYRIKKVRHYRTGEAWCIYPMYDFVHCLSDALEGITHSLCTLEFEDHRALYDWYLERLLPPPRPKQHEFARLNLSHTITSKRKLERLVRQGHVSGWDDPRLPTLCGLRRRGYTPEAVRDFCSRIGVTKNDALIEMSALENCLRKNLEKKAQRALAVLRPLKVVIENYPHGQSEDLEAPRHPADPSFGYRMLPFARELYIEQDDFMEKPSRKFFRLAPGREVRLRHAYLITCREVLKDAQGQVVELRCEYDPATRGGKAPDGRKVRGTLHWVAAATAVPATLRLYDRLFDEAEPDTREEDWETSINPHSLEVLPGAMLEPNLREAKAGECFQFERQGYFCLDGEDSSSDQLVFNRAVSLRDSWNKGK